MFRSFENALEERYQQALENGYNQKLIEQIMQYSFELGKRSEWFEIQKNRIMFRK